MALGFNQYKKGIAMTNTVDRVSLNTDYEVNARIAEQTERNIVYYSNHIEEIDLRLEKLNREWDIERVLETHAAAISVASIILGTLGNRRWLYLPGIVAGFLLQHATRGWCPPLPVLRRLGIRTQTEIEQERYALKFLRGDFNQQDSDKKDGRIVNLSQRVLDAIK
jgi:hypothetical protein